MTWPSEYVSMVYAWPTSYESQIGSSLSAMQVLQTAYFGSNLGSVEAVGTFVGSLSHHQAEFATPQSIAAVAEWPSGFNWFP